MKFEPREVTLDSSISERQVGNYVIVELQYLFGQHRIQVWNEDPTYSYPDVIGQQF